MVNKNLGKNASPAVGVVNMLFLVELVKDTEQCSSKKVVRGCDIGSSINMPDPGGGDTVACRVTQRWPLMLKKRYVIGRNPETTDIQLPHASMSRKHATLEVFSDSTYCRAKIEDLGSSNGTWLNGRRVCEEKQEAMVRDRMRLQFAQNPYTYTITSDELEAAHEMPAGPSVAPSTRKRYASKWDSTGSEEPPSKSPRLLSGSKAAFLPMKATDHANLPGGDESVKPSEGSTAAAEPRPGSSTTVYMNSFHTDAARRIKFLKLMGYKGGEQPNDPKLNVDKKCDDEIRSLEKQYCEGLVRRDGRKTGLGGV